VVKIIVKSSHPEASSEQVVIGLRSAIRVHLSIEVKILIVMILISLPKKLDI
jgi:hypothetical protein